MPINVSRLPRRTAPGLNLALLVAVMLVVDGSEAVTQRIGESVGVVLSGVPSRECGQTDQEPRKLSRVKILGVSIGHQTSEEHLHEPRGRRLHEHAA